MKKLRITSILFFIFFLCGCNIPNKEKDTKRWLIDNVKQVNDFIEQGAEFDFRSYFFIPENVNVTVVNNAINTKEPGTYTIMLKIISDNNLFIEKEFTFFVADTMPPRITLRKALLYNNKEPLLI
ncbi:MAG: hypothetical protein IJI57_16445 [Flexilinea sp.]|nr:hypothetical protein [Flexilinea sp.]